uniref:Uncharacterized protein n=1 Tax=Arundo donax TaxID=35708 RepID=A0A0A8Y075_ARUDO
MNQSRVTRHAQVVGKLHKAVYGRLVLLKTGLMSGALSE